MDRNSLKRGQDYESKYKYDHQYFESILNSSDSTSKAKNETYNYENYGRHSNSRSRLLPKNLVYHNKHIIELK